MSLTVYTEKGVPIPLTSEIGRGGEGVIYGFPVNQLECVKIYSKPLLPETHHKLELMVQNPPEDPTYSSRKHHSISWPTQLLYVDSRRSQCAGFAMPKIDLTAFQKALSYIDPTERRRLCNGFSWKYLFTAAYNFASSVAAIHERGYCIGDVNESNILIARNALISLIDCDSFQVPDRTSGKTYRCTVGKPEYTAPELIGKSYVDIDRTPESDCFAMAVLLFQFLMEGTHPYQAKGKLVEDAPSTQTKIMKGIFPYTAGKRGISPPDHAPPFDILPFEIRQLFERCFSDGHRNPAIRPSALEWFGVLRNMGNRFKQCSANQNHAFMDHLRDCPWCRVAQNTGKDPYPSPVGYQIALDDPNITLSTLSERIDYLRPYLVMALADGVMTAEEKSYLLTLGGQLQIPPKELERIIQDEVKKANAKTVSGGAIPQIEVSKREFEFLSLKKGSRTSGTVTISNVGGGALRGTITPRSGWLSVSQGQIDSNRHRQDLTLFVDTSTLTLGSNNLASVEIQSNGGNPTIQVRASIEVEKEALSRFRRPLTWAGLFVGGVLGYLAYSLLPSKQLEGSVASIASIFAFVSLLVWSAIRGKGGGFFAALFLGGICFAIIEHFPPILSATSWALAFGILANLSSRYLFALGQKGSISPILVVGIGWLALATLIVVAGIFTAPTIVGSGNSAGNGVQVGTITTCSSANGTKWRDYKAKLQFRPRERFCVYGEALNVNLNGRVDVNFDFSVLAPDGSAILHEVRRAVYSTRNPSVAQSVYFHAPSNAQDGMYHASLNIRNNLTGQQGSGATGFTVVSTNTATPPVPTNPVPADQGLTLGSVATCQSASGWRQFTAKSQFSYGEKACIYAEALNVNQAGRVDVLFHYRVFRPGGEQVLTREGRVSLSSADPSCWNSVEFPISPDLPPGSYTVAVDVRDNLSSRQVQKTLQFTVLSVPEQTGYQSSTANPATASQYEVRLFNCDDGCRLVIKNNIVMSSGFGQDTGFVNVERFLSPGRNELDLQVWNQIGAITYGFQVKRDQELVFEQQCGQAYVRGCDNNRTMPSGVARQFSFVITR